MDTNPYLTFTEVCRLVPGRPHVSAVWRWARRGIKVRGADTRIRLQHVRAGARLLTTQAWLDEFMRALANADTAHFEQSPERGPVPGGTRTVEGSRTPEQRADAAAAARRRMGL